MIITAHEVYLYTRQRAEICLNSYLLCSENALSLRPTKDVHQTLCSNYNAKQQTRECAPHFTNNVVNITGYYSIYSITYP